VGDMQGGSGQGWKGWLLLLVAFAVPPPAGSQPALDFFTLTPCRLYDSRWGAGPLAGGFDRNVPAGGYCGIPPDASAAALNFTVIDPTGASMLSAYPCCSIKLNVIQGVQPGRTMADNAVLGLGTNGQLAAYIDGPYSTTAGLVVDVSGYFRDPAPVQQWREWEQALLSPEDYTINGGDPYSEVVLDVRFTNAATGVDFLQPAFWDGDDLTARIFKVRTALPAGTWTWQLDTCTRNGLSCLAGWAPSQGTIFVQSNTASGNPLYDRGFVEQVETVLGGQMGALSKLQYPDGMSFAWVGDTAWTAPPREYDPDGSGPLKSQTAAWDAYLADRKSKGFTAVQIAPAVTWQLGSDSQPLPGAKGFSFKLLKGCADSTPIPDDGCWAPIPAYWEHFRKMVRKANETGMLVAVVGVMNPTGIDPEYAYSYSIGATAFARYLRFILGGLAVVYSPAFDDDADKIDPRSQQARSVLMNEVGNALKSKNPTGKPRPVTNHLSGGKSNCDEYAAFAQTGWMTHYLFQSGHGGAGDLSGPCAPTGTNDVQNAMERARVMPLTLSSYTNPKLPAMNAEGPYDATDYTSAHSNVDTRYRVRQAGYVSALSNAVGYSYGAFGLTLWDKPGGTFPGEPSSYFGLESAKDIGRLTVNLLGRHLVAHPEWILNNPAEQKYKMVLASDEASSIMAYLPGDEPPIPATSSNEIRIDASATQLPCLVCPTQTASPWTFTWVDPVSNGSVGASCSSPAAGQLRFSRPDCPNPNCDRLLKMEMTGTCPSAMASSSASQALGKTAGVTEDPFAFEVWSETSAGDGTSAIYSAPWGPAGRQEPVLLSPAGRAFQLAPRVGRVGSHQLVVWQADGLDGSLYGIYGVLLGPRGEIVGPFKINHYTEHDQREPAVAGGARGEALVVWSSYGQDGDRGGIFGRLVRVPGRNEQPVQDNLGEELEITEVRAGHQQHPRVLADAGGFWVAWETVDENGLSSALSVRHLGLNGRPELAEVRLAAEPGEQRKLLSLDNPTPGSVVVRWLRQNARGDLSQSVRQVIGPQGPLGPMTPGGG
jgi:uncharacterized protein DUF4038/uncharacterized protein DUF5060